MAKKKILKQGNKTIYPITNESCVLDNNGTSLKSKLGDLSDLKTDNKNSLVDAINVFKGAVVVISHNEELLNNVATKLIVFDNDKVFIFECKCGKM